jgi:hypothetical protein
MMLDSKVIEWIKSQKAAGRTKEQINEAMKKAGYKDEDIEPFIYDEDEQKTQSSNIFAILCLVFSFLLPPLAIIFGIISVRKIINENVKGKGLTIAGFLISTVPYVLVSTAALGYFGALNLTSLTVSFIVPSLIIIFGIAGINKSMKDKSTSFGIVYAIGILFILILPVAIGSIAFYGIVSPSAFVPTASREMNPSPASADENKMKLVDNNELPDRCALSFPLMCSDFMADSLGKITITIENRGNDGNLSNFVLDVENECTPKNFLFEIGESKEFTCEIEKLEFGKKYEKSIFASYTGAEGAIRTTPGQIRVTAR